MDTIIFYDGHKYCAALPEKCLWPVYVTLPDGKTLMQQKQGDAWQDVTIGMFHAKVNGNVYMPRCHVAYEVQRPLENLRLHTQERRIKELADIVNVQTIPVPEYATVDQRLAVVEENVALIREKLGLV